MSEPLNFLELTFGDSIWLLLFVAAATAPYVQSFRMKTPVSLATVISLMLVATLQFIHALVSSWFTSEFDPIYFVICTEKSQLFYTLDT